MVQVRVGDLKAKRSRRRFIRARRSETLCGPANRWEARSSDDGSCGFDGDNKGEIAILVTTAMVVIEARILCQRSSWGRVNGDVRRGGL